MKNFQKTTQIWFGKAKSFDDANKFEIRHDQEMTPERLLSEVQRFLARRPDYTVSIRTG